MARRWGGYGGTMLLRRVWSIMSLMSMTWKLKSSIPWADWVDEKKVITLLWCTHRSSVARKKLMEQRCHIECCDILSFVRFPLVRRKKTDVDVNHVLG